MRWAESESSALNQGETHLKTDPTLVQVTDTATVAAPLCFRPESHSQCLVWVRWLFSILQLRYLQKMREMEASGAGKEEAEDHTSS